MSICDENYEYFTFKLSDISHRTANKLSENLYFIWRNLVMSECLYNVFFFSTAEQHLYYLVRLLHVVNQINCRQTPIELRLNPSSPRPIEERIRGKFILFSQPKFCATFESVISHPILSIFPTSIFRKILNLSVPYPVVRRGSQVQQLIYEYIFKLMGY